MLMGDFLKYCNDISSKTPQDTTNPLIPILNEKWPFIELLIKNFIMNDDIVEYTIRMIKHYVRALGNQFAPMLQPFLMLCMNGFKQNPLGTFVYSVEFCFMDFGHQADKEALFTQALDFIIQNATEYLVSREICE